MSGSRITVMLPVRNAERLLPRWLASVEAFADSVVALDDGSTDDTRAILARHELVDVLLTNPVRRGYEGWDDRENRQRLIEAARQVGPDWLLFLDADERIDGPDGRALRDFVETDAIDMCAYGFEVLRMADDELTFDPDGLWVYRLFAFRGDMAHLPDRRLHFVPIPRDIPRERWIRTSVRIQHFASLTPLHREKRYRKYEVADPHRQFQDDYENLLRPPVRTRTWKERAPDLPVLVSRSFRYRRPWSGLREESRPAITAVVIAQNDEAVIERAVSALREQDAVDDFEVVVVGSGTDRTVELAGTVMPDARCVQLRRPVLPGEARNVGLWMARGEFITFPGSHVWLTRSSLSARLAAHDSGWELVTGSVLNGNPSLAGWASYYLDHSAQMPTRPSGRIKGPPGHASYLWADVWSIGGFPEDMRAGEDTVVNTALHLRGRRSFYEEDASFFHESPVKTARGLASHHFKRGRGMGRILRERSGGSITPWRAVRDAYRLTRLRLRVMRESIAAWGDPVDGHHRRARPLILLGALAAAAGLLRESAETREKNRGGGEAPTASVQFGQAPILAIMGKPGSPEFGLLGAGDASQAVRRLVSLSHHVSSTSPTLALSLVVAAATTIEGPDGDHVERMEDEQIAPYYSAAEDLGAWLLLQIQHPVGEAVQATKEWGDWLKRPWCGLFLDADISGDGVGDAACAVEYVQDLTSQHGLPAKPVLATGYPDSLKGVIEPRIVPLRTRNGTLPTNIDQEDAVVLV